MKQIIENPYEIYEDFVELIQSYKELPYQLSLILIFLEKGKLIKHASYLEKNSEKIVKSITENLKESVKIIEELHRLDIYKEEINGIYLFDKIDFTNDYTILYGNFLKPTITTRVKLMELQSIAYSEAI